MVYIQQEKIKMIATETTEHTEQRENTRCSRCTLWQKLYFIYN